jgi:PAS domain S-box-containing protein
VYVDAAAVATAEAPGLPPAQQVFVDLAWPTDPSAPDRDESDLDGIPAGVLSSGSAPHVGTDHGSDTDLLDAVLPPTAPRFWVATPLGTVPQATLCVASAEPRTADAALHAALADLADLARSSMPGPARLAAARTTGAHTETAQRITDRPQRRPSAWMTAGGSQALARAASAAGGDGQPLAFIEWDRQGRVVDWNPAAESIFGYSRKEARRLSLLDIVAPADRAQIRSVWDRQFQQEGGYFSYNANVTRDGRVILCEWHNTPLVNDRGEVFGVMSLVQDVTGREAQARAIRESKEFAENLIVSMRDGVLVFNASGTTIQVNDAFCRMTGFSRDDLLGTTLPYPFWPSEAYEELCVAFDPSTDDASHELTLRTRSGERFPVITHRAVMRDPSGEVISYVITVHDVTDQQAAERGLARERDLLQKIFDTIPVMIVVHDAEDGLLRVNRAFEATVGAGTAHMPGLTLDLDAKARTVMRSFVDALPEAWTDIPVTCHDGRVVESSWIGIRCVGGTRLGIGIDVTERTRRAEALERARDAAEEMNRLKTAFLANMSHEIRTPLTAILGFSEAIRESLQQDRVPADDLAVAVDFVLRIERGGRRLLDTLNAVLDLSRLEAGMMKLESQPLDVVAEMQNVAARVHHEAIEPTAAVAVRTPGAPVVIETDPEALRRVLDNLIGNAVKFTSADGQVTCSVDTSTSRVELVIDDTGVGIDRSFLPRIFQPFVQESSGIDRTFEGSGLGLAVTSQLVDLMGGAIDIESEKGVGTRVTVSLPRP